MLADIAGTYRELGFSRLRYKAVPYIYQVVPAEDDVHGMFRLGAARYRVDLAAAIDLSHRGRVRYSRRQRFKRAEAAGVRIDDNWDDITAYWQVLEDSLGQPARRGTHPLRWPRSSTCTTGSPRRSS